MTVIKLSDNISDYKSEIYVKVKNYILLNIQIITIQKGIV